VVSGQVFSMTQEETCERKEQFTLKNTLYSSKVVNYLTNIKKLLVGTVEMAEKKISTETKNSNVLENKEFKVVPIKIITDQEKIKIIMDKTRMKILKLLREGIIEEGKRRHELTVREMAELLNISTPQSLYHHVDLLVEHGFLYPAKEVKKKRSKITYYARTASVFFVVSSLGEVPEYDLGMGEFVKVFLDTLGIEVSDEEFHELAKLFVEFQKRETDIISKYAPLIKMRDEEDQSNFNQGLWVFAKIMLASDEHGIEISKKISKIIFPKLEKRLKELETKNK